MPSTRLKSIKTIVLRATGADGGEGRGGKTREGKEEQNGKFV